MAINSLSAASRGYSGLVSGINTQETVEKMLTGTQSKIDKANQKKTTLLYKQTMYRDVMTKLKNLQSTYLSFTSGTNLLSSAFYNNMTATVTPPSGISAGFSVSASSKAAAGNTSVEYIEQLAKAFTRENTFNSSATVGGKLDQDVAKNIVKKYQGYNPNLPDNSFAQGADAMLSISVGGKTVTFKNAPETFGGKSANEIIDILNAKLSGSSGIGAEARYVNGKLTIIADNPSAYITVYGNQSTDAIDGTLAMKMFGNVTVLSGQGTFSSAIDSDNYLPSINVELDGRKQDITISLEKLKAFADATTESAKDTAAAALKDDIQASLSKVFGTGVRIDLTGSAADDDIAFEFNPGTTSQRFILTGTSEVMGLMSMKTGMSNKLNSTMSLRDLNFTNALQGNVFAFNINGVDFSYTGNTTLSSIINDINSSKAGVKVSYNESRDRFIIQSAETGEGYNSITISQSEGNLMTALFGIDGSGDVTGFGIDKKIVGAQLSEADIASFAKGGVFTYNIGGTDVKFTMAAKGDGNSYTAAEFAEKMNSAFASNYGFMPDGTQAVQFIYDDTDKNFTIVSNHPDVAVKTVAVNANTNKSLLGFSEGDSTRITDGGAKLSEADIVFGSDSTIKFSVEGGTDIEVDLSGIIGNANATFDNVALAIQNKISAETGLGNAKVIFDEKSAAFRIIGVEKEVKIKISDGSNGENLEKLFGQSEIQLMGVAVDELGAAIAPGAGLTTTQVGQNAKLSINGDKIERATNSFEYNGLTFTLHTESKKDGGGDYPAATNIAVARDTDAIVTGIKEFLALYNETVNYLNDLYKADATYKNYAPLTDAQKTDMSDREVELWEEKSKEGLLRNDSNLQRILDAMRKAMYTKPEGSSIAIYDLGIATSYYSNDGNLVEMSDGDLRAFVEQDPAAVQKLFAGEGGIMTLLNDAITAAVRASYASPGYITSVAGSSSLDTSSSIYTQIKQIDDQLVTLERRYWSEYDRYWKQFNQMEQLVQQMNSQSSWLSQMMGS